MIHGPFKDQTRVEVGFQRNASLLPNEDDMPPLAVDTVSTDDMITNATFHTGITIVNSLHEVVDRSPNEPISSGIQIRRCRKRPITSPQTSRTIKVQKRSSYPNASLCHNGKKNPIIIRTSVSSTMTTEALDLENSDQRLHPKSTDSTSKKTEPIQSHPFIFSTNPTASTCGIEDKYNNQHVKKQNDSTSIKLQDLVCKLYKHLHLHGELDLALQPKLHLMLDLPKIIDKRRLYEALIQLEGFRLVSRSKEYRFYSTFCSKSSSSPLVGVEKRKTTIIYLMRKDNKISCDGILKEIATLQQEEFEAKHHLNELTAGVVSILPNLFTSQEEFMNFSRQMNLPVPKFD